MVNAIGYKVNCRDGRTKLTQINSDHSKVLLLHHSVCLKSFCVLNIFTPF